MLVFKLSGMQNSFIFGTLYIVLLFLIEISHNCGVRGLSISDQRMEKNYAYISQNISNSLWNKRFKSIILPKVI